MIKIKEKICQDEDCSNKFFQYKSTDKYCSYSCQAKHTKPLKRTELKRTPLKRKPFKLSQKSIEKMKAKDKLPLKKNKFQIEFEKQARNNKDRVIKEYGHLNCEKCSTTSSIQFSTHHIVFRSEVPKHPELNNLRNLIYLCYECHELFHKDKKSRNYLIRLRKLIELFGNLWGYEK